MAGTAADTARVAMFINSLQRGGAETQFLRVARALRSAGHEVRIYTLLDDNDFPENDIPVFPLSSAGRVGAAAILRGAVRMTRGWRPQVVISFLYQATLIGRAAARAARAPVVISSMRNERLESRLRTLLYRLTSVGDTEVITNSHRAAQLLQSNGTVRRGVLTVIPNGVDLALFDGDKTASRAALRQALGVPDTMFLYLGVGRLTPQKDWPTLVAAVSAYRGPEAHWLIVGNGPDEADVRAAIDRAGLSGRISLLGLRDDVIELLAACDGLVLCSRYEGLPNVVLEAMAAGRPVIASRVGGCPELVRPGWGTLVDPQAPGALAAAMASLAGRTHDERLVMGTRARTEIASRFSLVSADREWVGLVERSLAGARRRRASVAHRGAWHNRLSVSQTDRTTIIGLENE
ncbi:MAG: glycosyl transferase family 1 [Pseudonocardiales bacterium]|nr:MAG: glycosyl transferase family 1 [Pseudonocardiales bacterium]